MRRVRDEGFRNAWLAVHRWLGLTLGLVGALLGISGSLLVFDGEIDARLNPQRYAVSGSAVQQPIAAYLDAATRATGNGDAAAQATRNGAHAVALQLPSDHGGAVRVVLRGAGGSAPSRVYLDPPTAQVMDVAQGGGFVEWLHRFHGSLLLRDFWGREFIGVVGLAMLFSALSGIYLWWPGRAMAVRALRFRPRTTVSRNLHHVCGFYVSIVLAVLAFTGVYLAFPSALRNAVEVFSPVTFALRGGAPPASAVSNARGGDASIGSNAATAKTARGADISIGPDRAAEIARALAPGAAIAGLGLPGGADGTYRVTMREARDPHTLSGGNTLLLIDARSGAVRGRVDATTRTAGDTFLAWQTPLHTGEAFGLPGRVVAAIAGLAPAMLFVTGGLMWLRRPRLARRSQSGVVPPRAAANR